MKEWTVENLKSFMEQGGSGLMYFYTPICGTCQVASKMLEVLQSLCPDVEMGKADLNYMPEWAVKLEIKSVPCLLLIKQGEIVKTTYAFHSVPYLYEMVKEHLR